MRPYKVKHRGSGRRYLYRYSDLKQWMIQGRREGNAGMIPVFEDATSVTYRGFGTIENPCKRVMTTTIVKCPVFDKAPSKAFPGKAQAVMLDVSGKFPLQAVLKSQKISSGQSEYNVRGRLSDE